MYRVRYSAFHCIPIYNLFLCVNETPGNLNEYLFIFELNRGENDKGGSFVAMKARPVSLCFLPFILFSITRSILYNP